jgi:hypothetical protein
MIEVYKDIPIVVNSNKNYCDKEYGIPSQIVLNPASPQ